MLSLDISMQNYYANLRLLAEFDFRCLHELVVFPLKLFIVIIEVSIKYFMIKTPIILVNFKNYSSTLGKSGLELARALDKVASKSNVSLVLALNPVVLEAYARELKCPVIAQHVDPVSPGSHTGKVTCESIKLADCDGTLVNHSEISMIDEEIKKVLTNCKNNQLQTFLCVDSLDEAKKFTLFDPTFFCYEDPNLIGGDISIASENPEEIKKMCDFLEVPVLVGAGIKTSLDVKKAMSLGADGILVASAITKAVDPIKAFEELLNGFN